MAHDVTFAAFSCPHVPLIDPKARDQLLGIIETEQPDFVVHLGDGHEAKAASRWPTEQQWSLRDEFQAHNLFLQAIRLAAPKARRIFCWGNHDANILAPSRFDPQIRALCDPQKEEPELRAWKQVPYIYGPAGIFRLGQVTFGHGYEAGPSADEFQSILLGVPYGLWVGGHTHRPQDVIQARRTKAIPLPYWFCNAGCLRDLKPSYVHRKRTHDWGHAVVLGRCRLGRTILPGRAWEARTVILTTYSSWETEHVPKDPAWWSDPVRLPPVADPVDRLCLRRGRPSRPEDRELRASPIAARREPTRKRRARCPGKNR